MQQPQVMSIITDQNCFKMRKHFEVSDDTIERQSGDFEGAVIAREGEDGDGLFLPTCQVEGIFLLTELQVSYDLVVTEPRISHF